MISPRAAIATLSISASLLVGIAVHEGYVGHAYTPIQGDVPTIGFGATEGVKLGDKTTPERALVRLLKDVDSHANGIKACIKVPLYQHEFDAYTSLAYNIGVGAFCKSTLVKKLNAGEYFEACAQILRWTYFNGRDCRDLKNRCRGLAERRDAEYAMCVGG